MKAIFIVADTLRRDHLSCYGYFRKTSPFLDKLANEGVLFEDSLVSSVATGPGFTSLFTGLPAIQHRFYFTPCSSPNMVNFDDDWPTLPELIQWGSDYTTCALDNLINFRGHMKHIVRGFEYYINPTRTPLPIHHHLIGGEINKRAIPWIEEHKNENFFLFLHYWDPHTPYNQPEEYQTLFKDKTGDLSELQIAQAPAGYEYIPAWGKEDEVREGDAEKPGIDTSGKAGNTTIDRIDLYDGEIRYMDHLIEEIFACLESETLTKETVMIFTSDHGEYLGDIHHGKKTYGHPGIHWPDTNVPLIFWGPQFFASGKRVKGYVQHIDTTRTILEILNISQKPNLPGKNLLPYLKEEKNEIEKEFAVCEANVSFHALGKRSLIKGNWEYIWYLDGKEELYNLKDDPCERIDLKDKASEILNECRKALTKWRNTYTGELSYDPIYKARALLEKYDGSALTNLRRGSFWEKGEIKPIDYY